MLFSDHIITFVDQPFFVYLHTQGSKKTSDDDLKFTLDLQKILTIDFHISEVYH